MKHEDPGDPAVARLSSAVEARVRLPAPEDCRRIRLLGHLSQEELGEVVGVSASAIARWESGARTPRGARRERYSLALERIREAAHR